MKVDNLTQLQLLNLNFLLMRQISDDFKCDALRDAEREMILRRLYQLQENPLVNSCKCSIRMLDHLKNHWQGICKNNQMQTQTQPAARQMH